MHFLSSEYSKTFRESNFNSHAFDTKLSSTSMLSSRSPHETAPPFLFQAGSYPGLRFHVECLKRVRFSHHVTVSWEKQPTEFLKGEILHWSIFKCRVGKLACWERVGGRGEKCNWTNLLITYLEVVQLTAHNFDTAGQKCGKHAGLKLENCIPNQL